MTAGQDETPDPIEIHFVARRETKNTVLFDEYVPIGAEPHIVTLYVRKTTLATLGHPERLLVTLEVDDKDPFPRGRPIA
jgi:hypothetical protein